MNIYFLQPYLFKKESLPIFMKILKVNRVFDLAHYDYQEEVFYKSEKGSDEIEEAMKAAHICNYRILKPIDDDVKIQDIYKNSTATNPVFNLENCNDENMAIFISNVDIAYPFVLYTLNRLQKYADKYHYENRICFVRFEPTDKYFNNTLLNNTSIYTKGDFQNSALLAEYIKMKHPNYGEKFIVQDYFESHKEDYIIR